MILNNSMNMKLINCADGHISISLKLLFTFLLYYYTKDFLNVVFIFYDPLPTPQDKI